MASTCPFESKNTTKTTSISDNDWDKIIPISPQLKSVKYGNNRQLILLSYISFYHLIAVGLFASLFLPTIITGVLSLIFLIYPLVKQLLRCYNYLPTPYEKEVIRTTLTARCDGDFVVFLIGARPNGPNPLAKTFRNVGTAFQSMVAELEADSTLGYMGGDMYVGMNPRKSAFMHVQYWRSYEALQKWTHTRLSLHVKVMMDYRKKEQYEGTYGIWHETYKVRDGEYETVYGNMPPIGLALATQAVEDTKLNNGPGRMERRKKEKEAENNMNTSTK
ncbi:unnamed protein product [Adineta steineri]|uniref:Uncharacterized protein n=1 Tax=Adineta steineri TaxID=433720 RepID=A0A819FYH3_9BILA|nr:unnamed protein product [Adineta steineri]CAF1431134.1 unnamed protein product [Adineta steineri]CAF3777965.1 unnamed protein product [Adineta steineri]CAF3874437.1 unnamed protein product [Adineta steineri]